MKVFKRENLMSQLHESILTISFTKKDGSERQMLCTLRSDLLPSYDEEDKRQQSSSKPRPFNESILPVYDLENKGWRSIIITNINSVETVE